MDLKHRSGLNAGYWRHSADLNLSYSNFFAMEVGSGFPQLPWRRSQECPLPIPEPSCVTLLQREFSNPAASNCRRYRLASRFSLDFPSKNSDINSLGELDSD